MVRLQCFLGKFVVDLQQFLSLITKRAKNVADLQQLVVGDRPPHQCRGVTRVPNPVIIRIPFSIGDNGCRCNYAEAGLSQSRISANRINGMGEDFEVKLVLANWTPVRLFWPKGPL